MTDRIWTCTGMEGDATVALSTSGEILNGGLFAARLRDFARFATLFTPSWESVAAAPVLPEGYLDALYAMARPETYLEGEMGRRQTELFGIDGIAACCHWDAVLPDGDLYKAGRQGQGLYVSPRSDTAVVWFSTTFANSLWVNRYARDIVCQHFSGS